ncbi:DUF4393 domain-containing protein [Serratia entomophila]|uniref:DUF4393 domain-containing protein n=1 Tax=Serratia entomophila TaxID=42906 RepID=UPI00217BE940|nr:DUF4393 domain-containing protein [Serratia entomophila]CAI1618122.1 Uncharacterised protein [Serratia entomophila]
MDSDKAVDNAQKAASALTEIINLAKDDPNAKEAAKNLGKTALTITNTVNNCLLPLAVVNYGFEAAKKYFNEKFRLDVEAATKSIPPDRIIEPKASIVAPLLQGLAFSLDEALLKEMYLKLLASAMDDKTESTTHPAFVEVIKQLSSDEALILEFIANKTMCNAYVVDVYLKQAQNDGGTLEVRDFGRYIWDSGMKNTKSNNMYIDNLIRLRILQKINLNHIQHDEFDMLIKSLDKVYANKYPQFFFRYEQSILKPTTFGQQFIGSCIKKEWKDYPVTIFL